MARDQEAFGWLCDEIPHDRSCEVSTEDIRSAVSMLRKFSPEKKKQLQSILPNRLIDPKRFAEMLALERKADGYAASVSVKRDLFHRLEPHASAEFLNGLCNSLAQYVDTCRRVALSDDPWVSAALRDIYSGKANVWRTLLLQTQEILTRINTAPAGTDALDVILPNTVNPRVACEDARAIAQHFRFKNKVNWFFFKPKVLRGKEYLLTETLLDGRVCETADDFSRLADALALRNDCDQAWNLWETVTPRKSGPYSIQVSALSDLCETLRTVVAIADRLEDIRRLLKPCAGIGEPEWTRTEDVVLWHETCKVLALQQSVNTIRAELNDFKQSLVSLAATEDAHPVITAMVAAINNRDADEYTRCVSTIAQLLADRAMWWTPFFGPKTLWYLLMVQRVQCLGSPRGGQGQPRLPQLRTPPRNP